MDLDVDIENEKIKEIEKIKKTYDDKEANFYIYILKNSKEDVVKKYSNATSYSNFFFCQKGPKYAWCSEAEVLIDKGYPKVKDVLDKMFEWLKDLKWPGAERIAVFLLSLPKEELHNQYNTAMECAKKNKDLEWEYFLKEIFEKGNYI